MKTKARGVERETFVCCSARLFLRDKLTSSNHGPGPRRIYSEASSRTTTNLVILIVGYESASKLVYISDYLFLAEVLVSASLAAAATL